MTEKIPKIGAGIWVTLMPGTIVVLWASGFIGGKLGLSYVEPATFLLLRFAIVVALMLPIALLWRALAGNAAPGGSYWCRRNSYPGLLSRRRICRHP